VRATGLHAGEHRSSSVGLTMLLNSYRALVQ
jgi:hypothetical protein